MPIYTYKCSECNLELERIVPMREADTEQSCPKCNKPTEKQPSIPAPPVFKGNGWTPKYHRND